MGMKEKGKTGRNFKENMWNGYWDWKGQYRTHIIMEKSKLIAIKEKALKRTTLKNEGHPEKTSERMPEKEWRAEREEKWAS